MFRSVPSSSWLLLFALALLPQLHAEQAKPPGGRPPFLIRADQDQVDVSVILNDANTPPTKDNLEVGLLTSQQPNLIARPHIDLVSASPTGQTNQYALALKFEGLMPFGDSNLPLFYQGKQVDLLQFSRPGMSVVPSSGDTFIAREGQPLLIVLDNHSAFAYENVRARLRFQGADFCSFVAPDGSTPAATTSSSSAKPYSGRVSDSGCMSFSVPQYQRVTLLAENLPPAWFQDPASHDARSGKSTGLLTLRFQSASAKQGSTPITHEQDLPIDIQFEARTWAVFRTLMKVLLFLTLGALASLLLHVSLPNLRRMLALKDQLIGIDNSIESLSHEIDSSLRALLGADWLTLEGLRTETWPVLPGYADFAQLVEQNTPLLTRKVSVVQRLGAALDLARARIDLGYEYTTLDSVIRSLNRVSQRIQKDQITDDDWLFMGQTLADAEKSLGVLAKTDQDAFASALGVRWQALQKHFGIDPQGNPVIGPWPVPTGVLRDMSGFFESLPHEFCAQDVNGFEQWVQSESYAQADILLSALELLRDVETLRPPNSSANQWNTERAKLPDFFVNTTTRKLFGAKSLMWRLSENIFAEDIENALTAGYARLIIDPEFPSVGKKFRVAVSLFEDRLNSASARDLIKCRWTFVEILTRSRWRRFGWHMPHAPVETHEDGWFAFHYIERNRAAPKVSVDFFLGDTKLEIKGEWKEAELATTPNWRLRRKLTRGLFETAQLAATLLVPLITLASTTARGSQSNWWTLVGLGFGADTIKNLLVDKNDASANKTK